jgi:hypothetical protein
LKDTIFRASIPGSEDRGLCSVLEKVTQTCATNFLQPSGQMISTNTKHDGGKEKEGEEGKEKSSKYIDSSETR